MSSETVDTPSPSVQREQAKLLFEYTKFHLGLYAGVVTALLALAKLGGDMAPAVAFILAFAIVLILLSGAAAGIVVSNIPDHDFEQPYPTKEVGFFDWEWSERKVSTWCRAEHVLFWIAIVISVPTILVHVLFLNG